MHPVLGREVIEREQLLLVAGDLRDGPGVLGAVGGGEVGDGPLGALAVFGVADLREGLAGGGLGDLGRQSKTLTSLCTQQRPCRVPGNTSRSAAQNPSAPSPTASTGARMPRRRASRSSPAQDSVGSRCPPASATSSFFPSARTPMTTRVHTLS